MTTEVRPGSELAEVYARHIEDKTILTTGVTLGGLGSGFVLAVARARPRMLILAGRNETKNKETQSAIEKDHPGVAVRTLILDLTSLEAVRTAADMVDGWADVPHIDILVNNAGIMATEWAVSRDGFESQFAVNHLGHFLFTNLIMGKITKAAAPRIVNTSSNGHRFSAIRFDDFNFRDGECYNKWLAYGQSKTANSLSAVSYAEKLGPKYGLLAFSVQPGLVVSNLGGHLKLFGDDASDMESMKMIDRMMGNRLAWADFATTFKAQTPDEAAGNLVYAAFDPNLSGHNGAYIDDGHVADPRKDILLSWATSASDADRLWELSEKLVGQAFHYA